MKKYRLHWGGIYALRDAAITVFSYINYKDCNAILLTHKRLIPYDKFVWHQEANTTVQYNTPKNDFHYPDWDGIL